MTPPCKLMLLLLSLMSFSSSKTDAAPVVEMVSPAVDETFAVGDFLRLEARVYDDEDPMAVLLDADASQLSWQVDTCWTPSQCDTSLLSSSTLTGNGLDTDLPAPEPRDINVLRSAFIRVRVTYNSDAASNESVLMEREVFPELVDISFEAEPSFARVYLRIMGGAMVFPPSTIAFWKKQKLSLDAPHQRPYVFVSWENGEAQEHVMTVRKATTLTAYFMEPTPEPTGGPTVDVVSTLEPNSSTTTMEPTTAEPTLSPSMEATPEPTMSTTLAPTTADVTTTSEPTLPPSIEATPEPSPAPSMMMITPSPTEEVEEEEETTTTTTAPSASPVASSALPTPPLRGASGMPSSASIMPTNADTTAIDTSGSELNLNAEQDGSSAWQTAGKASMATTVSVAVATVGLLLVVV